MDIIIRDVEKIDGQYKIYNKDGTGGHWYITTESAEVVSSQLEPPVMQKIAEEFKNTIDYRILKDAYEWEVDIEEGYLWCLTAGDMGYEKTNFKLDVSNFSA